MSKENLEQFMKQVADSQDLQAKIGEEITGDALVALGAAHGCEFSIEDVQAGAELSDAELEGVAGGAPHYSDFGGRFQLVGGAMCSARSVQTKSKITKNKVIQILDTVPTFEP